MKKILITGADGQLGRELNLVLKDMDGVKILNTDVLSPETDCRSDLVNLDITDSSCVDSVLMEFAPDIIINCAAYTAVDKCESEEERAYQINALGVKNLAVAAEREGAKFIHISTDYVFDGEATTPYTEESPTNPQSAYGRTKLAGEEMAALHCSKYFIIRTAWLYGDGNNFVNTMLRLSQERKEIRVVTDQKGTPTSTKELVKMIVRLMDTEHYGVYHGTCEGSTNWYEFAKEIFRLAGISVSVIPITSDEYKTAAKRPAYSVLENHRFHQLFDERLNDWKTAIAEYINAR